MRAVIGRIAAAIIAAFVTWVASAFGVQVTADTAAGLTEAVTVFGMGIFTILYAIGHKLINRYINPADAAKPEVVPVSPEPRKL